MFNRCNNAEAYYRTAGRQTFETFFCSASLMRCSPPRYLKQWQCSVGGDETNEVGVSVREGRVHHLGRLLFAPARFFTGRCSVKLKLYNPHSSGVYWQCASYAYNMCVHRCTHAYVRVPTNGQ